MPTLMTLQAEIQRLQQELAVLKRDIIPQPVRHATQANVKSTDFAVVRDTYDGNQYVVEVERLVKLREAPFWELSDVREDVQVLPGLLSLDYQKLEWRGTGAWSPNAGVIAPSLHRVGNYWFAMPIALTEVRQFKVELVRGDYLLANRWDGVVQSGEEVQIAKPYLLRRTPFDTLTRNGITYNYNSNTKRTATNAAGETEIQVVVPSYVVGDIIYAVNDVDGGTDTYRPGNVQLVWLEDNRDGRSWAKEFE